MLRHLLLCLLFTLPGAAWGQSLRESRPLAIPKLPQQKQVVEPSAVVASPAGKEIPFGESLQKTITQLVIEQAPREYENKKKWGGTKKIMSGLDWEIDGVKVETRRQWKEANHGSWSMYRVKLIDAEDKFQVRLENLRDVGDSTAECDLVVVGTLSFYGRLSEWRRGIQLYSLSAEGEARVRLQSHLTMKMSFDLRTLPPDIVVSPKFTAADLILEDLKIQRISHADGPVVKQLSGVVEHGIDDYLADHRQQLVDKMNAQLEKKQDKLRIPLSKLVDSPWGSWFGNFFQGKK